VLRDTLLVPLERDYTEVGSHTVNVQSRNGVRYTNSGPLKERRTALVTGIWKETVKA
jgi:hypothetical protein